MIFGLCHDILLILRIKSVAMRYLPTIIFATMATTLISCRQAEVEPMIAAGYIESATPEELLSYAGSDTDVLLILMILGYNEKMFVEELSK